MKRILFSVVTVFASTCSAGEISAILNTSQEIPSPTGAADSAAGYAHLDFDETSNELNWNIAWQDLSGPATGLHIHAPAVSGATAGVALNIGDISGLTSPSIGSAVVDDALAASLLGGESYINLHTSQNAPGEIRGQINPAQTILGATLDTLQEIPAPSGTNPDVGGSARVAFDPTTNLLGWHIEWENLTGPATGMHFHGPAGVGATAGVQVNVGDISGLTSPSIGATVISDELASELLAGNWYLNIHTEANPPGEIRGQVVPEPSASGLCLWACLGAVGVTRKRKPSQT